MTFHSKLVKPVTLIIQAVAEEIAKEMAKGKPTKMTSEQIMNLLNLDDMSVSFSSKSSPAKKADDLPQWEGDLEDMPAGISKTRVLAILALAQAGVPDGMKIHTQKAELFKPNKQHEKFYTKGVFSGPQKDKDAIKWLCEQGEFGAPPEPEVVAELPTHKWEGDKKKAANLLKLVQEHKKKAEEKGEDYKYISWDTSRGRKPDDANFLYNDDYEICGPKEFKSEFLNLIAWLDENADFVEKSRKETPKAKGKKAKDSDSSESESEKPKKAGKKAAKKEESDESESSETSESSEEKPKGRKAAPKKAVKAAKKDESEESEESSDEKPKGRKAAPKKVVKAAPKKDDDESESSEEKPKKVVKAAPKKDESELSEESSEKPKGRKAAPKKVVKEVVKDDESESSEETPKDNTNDDPDADIDDKVIQPTKNDDDEATIEMDDDDESSCDEVEQKFVMGYNADKVQKFKAKLAKLLETENDKYLNAKTGMEIGRNEKSELKFQWIETHKIAVPNDLQEQTQAFVDMITK